MARIRTVEREGAPPEVAEIYDGKLRGRPGNAQKVLAHRPEILKTFLAFFASVGKGVDRRLYELVYIRVSTLNQTAYCRNHHILQSRKTGLSEADWTGLNDPASGPFSDSEKAALAFAEKLTLHPAEVTDEDFVLLRRHFDDGEILELDMIAALANLTNRFTGPLGLEFEYPEKLTVSP